MASILIHLLPNHYFLVIYPFHSICCTDEVVVSEVVIIKGNKGVLQRNFFIAVSVSVSESMYIVSEHYMEKRMI